MRDIHDRVLVLPAGNGDHNGGLRQINGIPHPTEWEHAADWIDTALTTSARPVGVGAAFQAWILPGEQYLLLMRTASP
jgi:hypothetical protein